MGRAQPIPWDRSQEVTVGVMFSGNCHIYRLFTETCQQRDIVPEKKVREHMLVSIHPPSRRVWTYLD
ncbi:unnamed protein product [Caretta caretta]